VKKLTPKEIERLRTAGSEIASVLEEIEELRVTTATEFERLLSELAEPKEAAREILDDAASAAEEYFDERSEKWQEGDAGQAYDEWKNRLRTLADDMAEDIEPPEIGDIERPSWVDDLGECDFAEFEA